MPTAGEYLYLVNMMFLVRNILSRYYRDNEMISFTRTSFSYDSLNEGSYYVFVGTMAQETDAASAPQVIPGQNMVPLKYSVKWFWFELIV